MHTFELIRQLPPESIASLNMGSRSLLEQQQTRVHILPLRLFTSLTVMQDTSLSEYLEASGDEFEAFAEAVIDDGKNIPVLSRVRSIIVNPVATDPEHRKSSDCEALLAAQDLELDASRKLDIYKILVSVRTHQFRKFPSQKLMTRTNGFVRETQKRPYHMRSQNLLVGITLDPVDPIQLRDELQATFKDHYSMFDIDPLEFRRTD